MALCRRWTVPDAVLPEHAEQQCRQRRAAELRGHGLAPLLGRAVGADLARMEDMLGDRAQDIHNHDPERSVLRPDQTEAVLPLLTGGKRLFVINAQGRVGGYNARCCRMVAMVMALAELQHTTGQAAG